MAPYTPENDGALGRRRLLTAILFVLLSLVLANLPPGPQQRIGSALRMTVLRPFLLVQETLARTRVRSADVARLQAEVDSLVGVLARRGALEEENRRLRDLLELSDRVGPSFEPASAIRSGTAGSESMLVLDVGREQGVHPGAPVIVSDGLVGVVREVRELSSVAMDWTHPDFRASAMTLDGQSYGIVEARRGEFTEADRLLLNGIAFYADLADGTRVVTSGLGGLYPRGIPIGTVVGLAEAEARWRKSYWLRPAVEPGAVTHVLVGVERDGRSLPPLMDSIWSRGGVPDSVPGGPGA